MVRGNQITRPVKRQAALSWPGTGRVAKDIVNRPISVLVPTAAGQ